MKHFLGKKHRLKLINITENVMKIYDGAFSDCKLLDEITIPINVTKINNNVFKDCSSLILINMCIFKLFFTYKDK